MAKYQYCIAARGAYRYSTSNLQFVHDRLTVFYISFGFQHNKIVSVATPSKTWENIDKINLHSKGRIIYIARSFVDVFYSFVENRHEKENEPTTNNKACAHGRFVSLECIKICPLA